MKEDPAHIHLELLHKRLEASIQSTSTKISITELKELVHNYFETAKTAPQKRLLQEEKNAGVIT